MKKFDWSFFIFIFVSCCFYVALASMAVLAFFAGNETIKGLIAKFDFNSLGNYYMILGIAYVTANLGEKYLATPKNFEVDENGKLIGGFSRKIKLWIMWSIYFIFNIALYFILNFKAVSVDYNIVSVLLDYVIISVIVMGASISQEFFAFLPSPIANILNKVTTESPETPQA